MTIPRSQRIMNFLLESPQYTDKDFFLKDEKGKRIDYEPSFLSKDTLARNYTELMIVNLEGRLVTFSASKSGLSAIATTEIENLFDPVNNIMTISSLIIETTDPVSSVTANEIRRVYDQIPRV